MNKASQTTLNEFSLKGLKDKAKGAIDKVKSKLSKPKKEFDDTQVFTKDEIVDKVKKMSDANKFEAINFVAKQMKQDPIKMISSNIGDIAKNVYDLFKSDVGEFKDDVKNIGLKNKDDVNKDKKISVDDIDTRKTRFGCIFDLDDGKKILEVAKKLDNTLKQAPNIANDLVKQAEDELKKAGVKDISKEQILNNTAEILGTIDNNSKLKSDKLQDKIEDTINTVEHNDEKTSSTDDTKNDASDVEKTDLSDDKSANDKTADKEIGRSMDNLRKKLRANIQKKIADDFKSSVLAGVFKKKDFIDVFAKLNGFENTWATKALKEDYVAAVRVDYYDDEADQVVIEKDEKAGYKVNPLKGNEKNKGIKKITDYIESIMKNVLNEKDIGKIYKYRKRWVGDNPDGNFDQIFVFAPYKGEGLKESLGLKNESKSLITEGNVLGKIFNTFTGLVGKEAGTKTTDVEHYRYLTKQLHSGKNWKYENFRFVDKEKEESKFESYGKIPGGLWWLPIAMIVDIAIKERKTIVNAIGNTYLKFKDKKGVIAEMDFYFNKLKYSTRFSTEDFKWHCVNPKDAKVKVSDDILLTSLKSEAGKKFKKYCLDTWSVLFKPKAEGEQAPFKVILDNADNIDLKSKDIDSIKKIADNYDKIEVHFKDTATESEITEAIKIPTVDQIKDKILEMLKNMALNKALQAINKFTRNYFNDAIVKLYKDKVVSSMSDKLLKATAKDIFDNHSSVSKAEDKEAKDKETDRREDNNTSTDIDEKSYAFSCMFDHEVGKKLKDIILKMNQDSIEATKKVEAKQKEVEQELKKVNVDKEDIKAFGPAAAAMLDAGKKPAEIKKAIDSAHKEVKESVINVLKSNKLLIESKLNKNTFKTIRLNLLNENINTLNRKYLTEGFLTSLFGKTVSTDLSKVNITGLTFWTMGDTANKELADKMFDILSDPELNRNNAEKIVNNLAGNMSDINASANATWKTKTVGPAIQAANILVSWMPLIAAAVIGISYKYKKEINALIDRGMTRYRNSKGIIAEANFKTKGADTLYKTYFNIKDFVWRCRNMNNINHQPSEELLKSSLDSDLGKKFRLYCKDTWDPIFNSTDNDLLAVNFSEMLKNPTEFGFDKKITGYLKDFVNNWKKIEEACLSDNYKFDIKMSDKKL